MRPPPHTRFRCAAVRCGALCYRTFLWWVDHAKVVKAIQEAGGKAAAVKADVSKLDEVTALFKDAAAAFPDEKIEVGV